MDGDEVVGKRRRNEGEWGRNKRRKLRAEGKAYTNSRKKVIPLRKTGNKCRCMGEKCLDESYISAAMKTVILDRFNSAGDTKKQDLLLAAGIKALKKAKLDDVKSLMKYLSQPTIDYINSIPEQFAGADADDDDD
ncbi:hypothetical protein LSAT2_025932, partial [Lamellibrachia satsuma]